MTPKDFAKQLCNKFSWEKTENGYKMFQTIDETKRCALITVDEILNIDNIKPYILHKEIIEFYQEVKIEIEKI